MNKTKGKQQILENIHSKHEKKLLSIKRSLTSIG